LKLWQPSALEVSWVGKLHRAELKKLIDKAIIQLGPTDEETLRELEENTFAAGFRSEQYQESQWLLRMVVVRNGLLKTLESLSQELLLEGGGGELSSEEKEAQNEAELKNTSPGPSPLNSSLSAYWSPTFEETRGVEPLTLDHGWSAVNKSEAEFKATVQAVFKHERIDGESLFEELTEISKSETSDSILTSVTRLSSAKGTWKAVHAGRPQQLHDAIWLLGEFAYLMLRRAKLRFHAERKIAFGEWIQTTVACNLGVDLCRHLPSWLLRFDMSSKVKLHTLYGVSLANIGRFFEANRHFNEAQAILSKTPDATSADLAIIVLRRAESLLTECEWIGMVLAADSMPSDHRLSNKSIERILGQNVVLQLIDGHPEADTWSVNSVRRLLGEERDDIRVVAVPARIAECLRKVAPKTVSSERIDNSWIQRARPLLLSLYTSVLDEAVALLDQAEYELSGHSQSSLWWSRLHTLRLRVYGLLEPLNDSAMDCLIVRKRSADQGIFESFNNAFRIARNDPFRKFRTLKYFFKADEWHRQCDEIDGPRQETRLPASYAEATAALIELGNDNRLVPRAASLFAPATAQAIPVDEPTVQQLRADNLLQAAIADLIQDRCKKDAMFAQAWNAQALKPQKSAPPRRRHRRSGSQRG
jgi:hypothetical protein